jgi:iron complex transport system substrate-binding protein
LYGPFKTIGSGSYINDLIEMAGGSNIAANATGSVLLSAEQLVQADPELILFVDGFATPQTFTQRPGVASLTAVRTGHLAAINRYWLVEGAGLPQSIQRLREALQTAVKSGAKEN